MQIIYTKDEVQRIMQSYFRNTHYGPDDKRPIENMTLAPDQITIVIGDILVEEETES